VESTRDGSDCYHEMSKIENFAQRKIYMLFDIYRGGRFTSCVSLSFVRAHDLGIFSNGKTTLGAAEVEDLTHKRLSCNTSSEDTFQYIIQHIHSCDQEHGCGAGKHNKSGIPISRSGFHPTRLLELSHENCPDSSAVRLIQPFDLCNDVDQPSFWYATLAIAGEIAFHSGF
jgi:hypothetical protein